MEIYVGSKVRMRQYEETNTHTLGSWDRHLTLDMKDIELVDLELGINLDWKYTLDLKLEWGNMKKLTLIHWGRGIDI